MANEQNIVLNVDSSSPGVLAGLIVNAIYNARIYHHLAGTGKQLEEIRAEAMAMIADLEQKIVESRKKK